MSLFENVRRINLAMVFKIMGWLLMIEAAFMAVPAIVAVCWNGPDCIEICCCSAFTCLCGYCLNRCIHPEHNTLGKREGFLLTAMVWVIFSIFGMLPFLFSKTPLSVVDAFFEAICGFTTTGCSSYPYLDSLGPGLTLWRALMQWIGGMGIILFTLAVVPMLNHAGGMQMFNAEVTGITHEKTKPRISSTAKSLWMVYITLTVVCVLLLWAGPMDLFESICHAFGILSTGGFSTSNDGLAYWSSSYIDVVVTFFMFLGGTNFTMIVFACSGQWSKAKRNYTLKVYVGVIFLAFALISLGLICQGLVSDWREATIFPLFQVVAAITSTGYTLTQLPHWCPFCMGVLMPLIFIGACAGSTSGGAKIDRGIVLGRFVANSVRTALMPNKVTAVVIDKRVLAPELVHKTVAFLCLYCIVIAGGAFLLTPFGVPVSDSLFTALSCVSNSGISPSALGMSTDIALLPAAPKLILGLLMLIGRLEIFTIIILFTPSFWRK